MNIGIVGLGLIGGSLARAFSQRTEHRVLGTDLQRSVTLAAKMLDAISEELTEENLPDCDILFLCLYPEAAMDWVKTHAHLIKKETLVSDTCGIKAKICRFMEPYCREYGFTFIGAHPMAGAAEYVEAIDASALTLLGWLDHGTVITLYDDDGESDVIDFQAGLTVIDVQVKDGVVAARAEGRTVDASRVVLD